MARPLSALLRHHKGDNTTLWAVLGLVALGALGVFALIFPLLQNLGGIGLAKGQWNLEISLTIDTPNGPVSGSVVRTYYAQAQPAIAGGGHSGRLEGEALAIEIMPGKWLFGLADNIGYPVFYTDTGGYEGSNSEAAKIRWYRSRPEGYGRAITINTDTVYEDSDTANTTRERDEIDRRNRLLRETNPRQTYPGTLITFTDINDPSSVEMVDLADLEKTFGEGVRFVEGSFNFTEKEITKGKLYNLIPWLYSGEISSTPIKDLKKKKIPGYITFGPNLSASIFDTEVFRRNKNE